MAEEGYKVTLNVYDPSNRLARQLSTSFLGKPIEAIWHAGVAVYGTEYYFGGRCGRWTSASRTSRATCSRTTSATSRRGTRPRPHNCNNFSDEVANFLVGGAGVPEYILNLPNEVVSSPMGPLIIPMIQNLEVKVQEEVMKEFAAIMASGTLRVSEAAALAMRRVLERHGDSATMQQS